jgi:hypothetical protein
MNKNDTIYLWNNILGLNLVPDEFCCLSALMWESFALTNPISVAEWAMRYEQEENQ